MVMLALGWTVTVACLAALVQQKGVFMRTPKVHTPSRLARAVLSTGVESIFAAAFLVLAPAVAIWGPHPIAWLAAVLLLWQGVYWACAPAAALSAQGVRLTPSRRLFRRSPQNEGGRVRAWPRTARRLGLAPALAVLGFLAFVPAVATAPDEQAALDLCSDDVYLRNGIWVELRARAFGRVTGG